ncbi:hypothetical protein TRAPUB_10704 [Trametes pubescens]|uniref:Uncharacterized protein n=1 Tax=Trametes pubescens TaxID=154538 RepID=A0A1M2VYZ8_TRAPU|nr:hypothetical protein TRAPUB_10704 [Trametes pubescens]
MAQPRQASCPVPACEGGIATLGGLCTSKEHGTRVPSKKKLRTHLALLAPLLPVVQSRSSEIELRQGTRRVRQSAHQGRASGDGPAARGERERFPEHPGSAQGTIVSRMGPQGLAFGRLVAIGQRLWEDYLRKLP